MSERKPIRVVVVDDHPMVRDGIAAMLLAVDDLTLVGTAADGDEALRVCEEVHPDAVLMDLQLPGRDGIATISELHRRVPEAQVLVLTSFSDDHLVREAFQAGAIGYLLKDVGHDELVDGIRAVGGGRTILARPAVEALIRAVTDAQASAHLALSTNLTARESEVLGLVVAGLRNQEIADRLVVSRATAKYHIQRLFFKLGASTRTELVAVALQRHLVDGAM